MRLLRKGFELLVTMLERQAARLDQMTSSSLGTFMDRVFKRPKQREKHARRKRLLLKRRTYGSFKARSISN
jgi:hypothetical protein